MPVNWATHVDMETGRPVETPDARYDETLTAKKITPGPAGAHGWHPMSYNPDTGLVYIPARQSPLIYMLDDEFERHSFGMNLGVNFWDAPEEFIDLPPEFQPEYQGVLLAWDPVTQREAWRAQLSGFENGGVLSTAGNLVFQGNAEGDLVAYDALTGERLWSTYVQTGVLAPPITYAIDGEQYVAVVAGWGAIWGNFLGAVLNPTGEQRNISRVLAFRIGGNAELPEMPEPVTSSEPPDNFGTPAQVAAGASLYTRHCSSCHGVLAISGGVLPDLRHSTMTSSPDAFRNVVLDGVLLEQGMASFAEVIDENDTEAIRAFIASQANQ